MRVLFVENHRVFAETVIDQFLPAHEVVIATTVAEAKALMSQSFDAALVDYDLPDVVAVSSREEGNVELRAAGAKVTCSKKDFRAIDAAIAGAFR